MLQHVDNRCKQQTKSLPNATVLWQRAAIDGCTDWFHPCMYCDYVLASSGAKKSVFRTSSPIAARPASETYQPAKHHGGRARAGLRI